MRKRVKKPLLASERKERRPSVTTLRNASARDHSGVDDDDDDPTNDNYAPSVFIRFCKNLSIFKYIIPLLLLPPILNYGALHREATALVPKGQHIDMGYGQKMFIYCKGHGLPTVILDAPTGTSSDIWLFVHEELALFSKVCIYDRSGIGSSDAIFEDVSAGALKSESRRFMAQPSSLEQMTSDLHYLVTDATRLPRPLILVGAEVASLVSRMFAIMHPNDVSSIVLLDPLVETMFIESDEWKEFWYSKLLPTYQSLHLSASLGFSRIALLIGWLHPLFYKDEVPEDVILRQKSLLCNPRHINAVFYEHLYMNASFSQMSDLWNFQQFPKHISVSVITRKEPAEYPPHLHAVWKKLHKDLKEHLHRGCRSIVVEDTDFLKFYSHVKPIVAAVRTEIDKVKYKNTYSLPSFAE